MTRSEFWQRDSICAYKLGRLNICFKGLNDAGQMMEIKSAEIARMCEMPFEDLMKRLRREFRLVAANGGDPYEVLLNISTILREGAAKARAARRAMMRAVDPEYRARRARKKRIHDTGSSDAGRAEAKRTLERINKRRQQ